MMRLVSKTVRRAMERVKPAVRIKERKNRGMKRVEESMCPPGQMTVGWRVGAALRLLDFGGVRSQGRGWEACKGAGPMPITCSSGSWRQRHPGRRGGEACGGTWGNSVAIPLG